MIITTRRVRDLASSSLRRDETFGVTGAKLNFRFLLSGKHEREER